MYSMSCLSFCRLFPFSRSRSMPFSISSNYPESWKLFSAICTRSILLSHEISAYQAQRCSAPSLNVTYSFPLALPLFTSQLVERFHHFFSRILIFSVRNSYKFNHILSDKCGTRNSKGKEKGCGKNVCVRETNRLPWLLCFFLLSSSCIDIDTSKLHKRERAHKKKREGEKVKRKSTRSVRLRELNEGKRRGMCWQQIV